ncbi:MAG: BamA/TamA family outer membrane protein [Bacteroidota bacterium]
MFFQPSSTLLLLRLLCLLLCGSISSQLSAQAPSPLLKRVYLLGNLDRLSDNAPLFDQLSQRIQQDPHNVSVLLLGDLYPAKKDQTELLDQEKAHIRRLVDGLRPSRGNLHIFGGDKDWNNSGAKGDKHIRKLEKFIEKDLQLYKAFIPSKSCPGPQIVELDESLSLIAINSQWFMHPYDRPEAPQTDCKILSEADFWEELEEAIESVEGKNVIIAAHHPVYSNGPYAGKKLARWHLLPVLGTFVLSHRQNIGRPSDLAYEAYAAFRFRMRELLSNYHSVIYASGHEHNLEVLKKGDNYFLNSGALLKQSKAAKAKSSLLSTARRGLLRLDYYQDGKVEVVPLWDVEKKLTEGPSIPLFAPACGSTSTDEVPRNRQYPACPSPPFDDSSEDGLVVDPQSVVAGPEYITNSFRRWSMGEHYRSEWTQPIESQFLNLQEQYGGLIPYAKGGGLQTHSLKFKAGNGKVYAFRSVNKDPVKALTDLSRQTIYRHIVKDLITTQHPYGGLFASRLLDATDILHPQPLLFLMPDDPQLDVYRQDFRYRLGTLEIRPRKARNGQKGFGGSDDIDSSNKMFRTFYKDHDNRIDAHNYARARVFDMWVGDWDRHEDNWKWAAFREGKSLIYRPIPRDRDHVFSQWEGLIPSIADKVVPNAEHFDFEFKNVNHLNWKARHLDRQLANELDREDWISAADYLAEKMTDGLLDSAVLTLPGGIRDFHGDEIVQKLHSRRSQLEYAATELYKLLATEVDVVGSNKREIFEVDRQADGSVWVRMYDRNSADGSKGKLLYERHFLPEETNEIRLFGLGKDDEFYIAGQAERSILVRIIGGKGRDIIKDRGQVRKGKSTWVYDSRYKDQILLGQRTRILRPANEAVYNNKQFEFSYLSPLPKFRISSGNRFGLELQMTYFKREFNKPDFGWKHQAKLIYYTALQAHRLDLRSWRKHAIGLTDLNFHIRWSSLFDKFPFFYGLGNDSDREEDLALADFYRTDFNLAHVTMAFERRFMRQSLFRYGFRYEYNNVRPLEEVSSIFQQSEFQTINGLGRQHQIGIIQSLDLDFRDDPQFSRKGSQLFVSHQGFVNARDQPQVFGRIEGYLAHYMSARLGLPVTLALRVGGSQTYGDVPFYHLSTLGSNAYLRTYVRNRFLGKSAAFGNSELRFHLGTIRTPLVPIRWGVYGFADGGRVWQDDLDANSDWHAGWGGGLYVAPFTEQFNIILVLGENRDGEFYFSISTGFDLQ